MQNGHTTLSAQQAHDLTQPATCFTLSWDGFSEGFRLTRDDPRTNGVPALFVGATFVRVAKRDGATYHKHKGTFIVRRATIEEKVYGNSTLRFLTLPMPLDDTLFVVVDTTPPPHLKKFKHRMWVGIRTSVEKKLEQEEVGNIPSKEYLLAFKKEGEWADVFFADGRVVRLRRKSKTVITEKLTIEEQAAQRIGYAQGLLRREDQRLVDFAYYQLIAILDIAGPKSAKIFSGLYDVLADAFKENALRGRALATFMTVLREKWPEKAGELDVRSMAQKLSCLGRVVESRASTH
jgi:hypothetical protein